MDKFSIFSLVLAVSITLKPVPITALQGTGQSSVLQSGKQQKAKPNSGKNNKTNSPTPIQITVTTPEISPADKAKADEQREREIVAQEAIVSLTRALKNLAFVQAFITAFALIATFIAANAAKKSAEIAEATLHLTQGADIHLQDVLLNPTPPPLRDRTKLEFVFKNYGKSRAIDVIHQSSSYLGNPSDIKETEQYSVPAVLAAETTFEVPFEQELSNIASGKISDIEEGKVKWGFKIILQFTDVFGTRQKKTFIGLYKPELGAFSQQVVTEILSKTKNGNADLSPPS
jgi:hypothetical protein